MEVIESGIKPITNSVEQAEPSLWREAYENPAATVTGAALAVGAAFGVGRYARALLANRSANILLLEGTNYFGQAMKTVLEEGGNSVTWLRGVTSVEPGRLVGETVAGQATQIDTGRFDLAVVCGGLEGNLGGHDVIPRLVASKLPSIGLSTSPGMTQALEASGSRLVADKAIFFQSLVDGSFNPRGAMSAPASYSRMLNDLRIRMKADETLTREPERRLREAIQSVGQ